MAIPLVADTKQRRKVSRETKKEKERQEKTAENEHDVRSIKIGLYYCCCCCCSDFSVRCVSSGRVINSSVDTSSVRSSVVKFVLRSPGKKDKQSIEKRNQ